MITDREIELARQARTQLQPQLEDSDAHTTSIGIVQNPDGSESVGVVVNVAQIKTYAQLQQEGKTGLPRHVVVDGEIVRVKVNQAPQPTDMRLMLDLSRDYRHSVSLMLAYRAARDHQRCFNCPCPGGVQIAPEGAQWVGTLGCLIWPFGADTNYHVAHGGQFPAGTRIQQPSGRSEDFIGVLKAWASIDFRGGSNKIDYALIDIHREGGKWGQGTDTVKPELYDVGPHSYEVVEARLGDEVIKSGRTTGVTRGRCVGIDATSHVNYGQEGTARFDGQLIIQGLSGEFSGPGDSGSTILRDGKLWGKLFAGGGGQTIANPYTFCLEWLKRHFSQAHPFGGLSQ